MNLFKTTAIYTFANIFSRAISFILLPLYSNLIPPDEFGVYFLIISAYAVAAVFFQGGMHAGFTKFYLDETDPTKRKIIFSNVLSFIIILSLSLSVILSALIKPLSILITDSDHNQNLILMAIWMLFFDTIFFYVLSLFKNEQKAKSASKLTVTNGVINFGLNILFIYFLRQGINGILISQLIANIVSIILVMKIIQEHFIFIFDKVLLKSIMIFSVPLLLGGILSTLVDFADRFILDHFMDKAAVGIYSFAYRIALIMNVFVISFRTAWTPYAISLYNQNNYVDVFGKSLLKLISLLTLLILTVSLFADDLFKIEFMGINIFNNNYLTGLYIIPIILLSYAFNALISFYSIYPYVAGKSKYFLYSDLFGFGVNLVLNFILIPVLFMKGAAYATLISYAASFIFLLYISRKIKFKYYLKEMMLILICGVMIFWISYELQKIYYDILGILLFILFAVYVLKNKLNVRSLFFNKIN